MNGTKGFYALLFCFAFSMHAHAANSESPKTLTIGTASPGGVYLPYGQFLTKLWTEKVGIPVDAISIQ